MYNNVAATELNFSRGPPYCSVGLEYSCCVVKRNFYVRRYQLHHSPRIATRLRVHHIELYKTAPRVQATLKGDHKPTRVSGVPEKLVAREEASDRHEKLVTHDG